MSTPVPVDTVPKTPLGKLDYGLALGQPGWLSDGETLASATCAVVDRSGDEDPAELTSTAISVTDSGNTVVLTRLEGGTDDTDYLVTLSWVTTPNGQEDSRTFAVRIRNR